MIAYLIAGDGTANASDYLGYVGSVVQVDNTA